MEIHPLSTITARLGGGIRHEIKSLPWLGASLGMILLPALMPAMWPVVKPGLLSVFLHLAGLLLLPCLFGVRVRTVLLWSWPVVVLVPVAMFCYLSTQQQPSEWFFLVLRETNTKEASVFVPQIVGFTVMLAALVAAYRWVSSHHTVREMHLGPLATCAVIVFALLIPAAKVARAGLAQAWKEEAWRVGENYPVGTIAAAVKAASLSYQIAHRSETGNSLVVKSTLPPLSKGKREIHILVIGETARASSFQLNGYERETNPLLAQIPGLLNFTNVIAPAPVTTISVPVMLTPSSAVTAQQASTLPSILNVFKNAGFSVHWISTQLKHGFWDTRCSTYSRDATDAQFLSGKLALSGEPRDAALDAELIKATNEALDRGEQKVLIVLHTMGSHAIYSDRYPEEFNRFHSDPAICAAARSQVLDSSLTTERAEHLRNAYDNSILYTDFILSRLISLLAEQRAVSTLYYVSDHGENGADAAVMPFGHGTLTTDVLRVPMIMWLSPEYKTLRADRAEALTAHQNTPFSSDTTFQTLADVAGLTCDLFKRERSAASADFNPGPRMVTALDGTLVDYDKKISPIESKRKGWHPLSMLK